MGRASSGYTIIEVLIVIAVTGLLFFSALVLINGQQGNTQFSQAMLDLSSKMQNYVGQIKAGSYPGLENYTCSVSATGRPTLTAGASTASNCVALGRAFEVQPNTANSNIIHSYIILGLRTYTASDGSTQTASTVDQANPEPAGTLNGPAPCTANAFCHLLVDDYTLNSGAKILSSKSSNNEYDIVGLYNQLESGIDTGNNGSVLLSMRAYNYLGSSYPDKAEPQLRTCIEEQTANGVTCGPPVSTYVPTINQWLLCVQSGSGSGTAQLEVDSSASGITVKYIVKDCS